METSGTGMSTGVSTDTRTGVIGSNGPQIMKTTTGTSPPEGDKVGNDSAINRKEKGTRELSPSEWPSLPVMAKAISGVHAASTSKQSNNSRNQSTNAKENKKENKPIYPIFQGRLSRTDKGKKINSRYN
jgi:hypothetical protein